MYTPYIISFIVISILIVLPYTKISFGNRLTIYILIFLSSLDVSYFFTDPNVGLGKFPITAILPILFVSLIQICLELKANNTDMNPESNGFLLFSNNFFFAGIFLIISTIVLELIVFDGTFSPNSYSLILFGVYLICFNKIPDKYHEIKLISFIFILLFCMIFPLFTISKQILTGSIGTSFDSNNRNIIVFWTLGRPLSNLLHLFGYEVWAIGDTVYYIDQEAGLVSSVSISEGCSGINSVLIFICALFSYISVRYKFNKISISLFFLGVIISYLSNLLRMSLIILAGHYYGSSALIWTHANIGWLIFTIWIFFFWKFVDWSLSTTNYSRGSS